ncbi:hypothetical protein C0989_011956 [Termitomyces sp. Mn162]|nr:hypothetical protein C0989_011956 [Termitomyces sp. Mn162]
MNPADAINPSVQAVSIHGTEWKHKKFSHVSPTTNFTKWSKALKIHLALLRLKSYVVSPLAQTPGKSNKPMANQNLMMNNNLAQAIILTALDESEYKGLDETKTAASLYKQVKTQVEGAALPASLEDDHALDMKLPSAFCAHPGGAMEKQGIDTAQNAMCTAATAKGTGSTGGNAKVYTQLTGPKSNIYLMEEGDLKKLQMLSGGLSTASFWWPCYQQDQVGRLVGIC